MHIGNADFLPDGKVNFAKHYKQFSILSQMKQFQQWYVLAFNLCYKVSKLSIPFFLSSKYSINESEPIISYFDNFDNYLQDEVMWQISESIKPRGGGSSSSSTNAN